MWYAGGDASIFKRPEGDIHPEAKKRKVAESLSSQTPQSSCHVSGDNAAKNEEEDMYRTGAKCVPGATPDPLAPGNNAYLHTYIYLLTVTYSYIYIFTYLPVHLHMHIPIITYLPYTYLSTYVHLPTYTYQFPSLYLSTSIYLLTIILTCVPTYICLL